MTAIAAGLYYNLAFQSNGTVVAWGYNQDGQTDLPVGLSQVTAIAANRHHALAARVIPPLSPYELSILNYPGVVGDDALPGAQPKGDGLENILKFAFNMNPNEAGLRQISEDMTLPGAKGPLQGLPLNVMDEGRLGLYYLQPAAAFGITVMPEFHDDLSAEANAWTPQADSLLIHSIIQPEGTYELRFAIDPAANPGPRRFGRARVESTATP